MSKPQQEQSGPSWTAIGLGASVLAAGAASAYYIARKFHLVAPSQPTWLQLAEIDEQRKYNGQIFPLIVSPAEGQKFTTDEFLEKLSDSRTWIKTALLKYGALVFRGFPVECAEHFDAFVKSFGLTELPYVGGAAPRVSVCGAVFTTNESPPDKYIPFHHEMAQVPKFPHKLFFYCETPPATGGQTSIIPSWEVVRLVKKNHPDFVSKLLETGVRYKRVMPVENDNTSAQGRSWKATFLTDDKTVAESKLLEQGSTFRWLPGDDLEVTSKVLSAIRKDDRTKREVWFNSLLAAHPEFGWIDSRNKPIEACTFGDGTPFDPEVIRNVLALMRANKTSISWQQGDVMMIDNRTVMHSRETFSPPRRVLASLWTDN